MPYIRVKDRIFKTQEEVKLDYYEGSYFEGYTFLDGDNVRAIAHYKIDEEENELERLFDEILAQDGKDYKILDDEEKDYLKQTTFSTADGWFKWYQRNDFYGAIFTEQGIIKVAKYNKENKNWELI